MTGRECKKGYKFRAPKHAVFKESHKWPAPPKKLKFIDETRGVELGETADGDEPIETNSSRGDEERGDEETTATSPEAATVGDSVVSEEQQQRPSLQAAKAASWPLPDESLHGSSVVDEPLLSQRGSLSTPGGDHTSQHDSQHDSLREHSKSVDILPPLEPLVPPTGGIYTDRPIWPIQGRQEATLFRHYVDKLGFWLDACDQSRSFETEVPQRAGSCPILLNAIFALAARHLSLTSAYDSLASNRYHDECLNYLIPLLDHAATVSDENLFAATIILRVLEEIDVNTVGQDTHGHLLGIHAFVNAGDRFLMPGTLTAACFWAGLRQEIYSAVINQQVVRMNLGHAIVDRSTTPADDFVWANRAIVHCADVLNFCFGAEAGSVLRWGQLEMANREWKNALPPSYTPIFYRERTETEAFPEVWYQKACHRVTSSHVHGMYGDSNWVSATDFSAPFQAGDRFDERADQEALLNMLSITEKAHARPTTAVKDQLMHAWGWMDGEAMSEG
ncbi:hypothetical protein KHU50_003417 [Colletotrichum sp. SAR 10_65]|nr:hypothetical protein KHU50_003417 [Colletotrichum sp. SAR 10_65]KAI8205454.1 hypothetical protein K4K52_004192 [Colletotrichum sp. SAR 10_76]